MARYNGPVCRLCRREGMKLFLKGERCYTEKCAIEKRNMPPGQHGRARKAKMVGYAVQLLERRLDNAVYRLGFATSRPQARQLVRHGHFLVNGKKVNIPSYSLKAGDVVTVRESSRENASILHAIEEVKGRGVPEWLTLDGQMGGKVMSVPTREQI